jgi:hypothetical protein
MTIDQDGNKVTVCEVCGDECDWTYPCNCCNVDYGECCESSVEGFCYCCEDEGNIELEDDDV